MYGSGAKISGTGITMVHLLMAVLGHRVLVPSASSAVVVGSTALTAAVQRIVATSAPATATTTWAFVCLEISVFVLLPFSSFTILPIAVLCSCSEWS